jgi:predicted transcriptional regulator
MSRVNVTCRLEEDDVAFIDQIASSTERDRSYYIKKAVHNFVMSEREMLEEIEKAIAEADRGEFVSEADMNATWTELGA